MMNIIAIATRIAAQRAAALDRLQPSLRSAREREAELAAERDGRRQALETQRQVNALLDYDIPGFFPSPPAIVLRMIELADIRPGMTVLEPSAGTGAIADAIRQAGVEPICVEVNRTLAEVLRKKNYQVFYTDFLAWQDGYFACILLNPPFEHGFDCDHIRHAYDCLAPGGRLVAIASEGPFFRSDRKAIAFREWLEAVGGASEKLPDGSFLPSGTGVATRIVVIERE